MSRQMELSHLLATLDSLGISPKVSGDLIIQFSDTDWANMTFGTLSQKSKSKQTIICHWKNVANLLGGIGESTIRRGIVKGVEMAGNGRCTIDMSTDWIRKYEISEDDFMNGIQKFCTTKEVQRLLGYSKKYYGFHEHEPFLSNKMKVGTKIVLILKDTVISERKLKLVKQA